VNTFSRILPSTSSSRSPPGVFDVAGEAVDGAGALDAVPTLTPDVVALDIRLPDLDGFGVAEVLAGDDDAPVVVLVSSRARSDGDEVRERPT
jgi:chemotaxis response regulator CheB